MPSFGPMPIGERAIKQAAMQIQVEAQNLATVGVPSSRGDRELAEQAERTVAVYLAAEVALAGENSEVGDTEYERAEERNPHFTHSEGDDLVDRITDMMRINFSHVYEPAFHDPFAGFPSSIHRYRRYRLLEELRPHEDNQ